MRRHREALRELIAVAQSNDLRRTSRAILDLLLCLDKDAANPEQAGAEVAELIRSGRIKGSKTFRSLIALLGTEWDDLSVRQRQHLVPALAAAARSAEDSTEFLVCVETMARESADPAAVAQIVELRSRPDETARFMVAHALWHVLSDGPTSGEARDVALAALKTMAQEDPSADVREEARRALAEAGQDVGN